MSGPSAALRMFVCHDHIPIFGERAQQFQDVALAFLTDRWETSVRGDPIAAD